MKKLTLLLSLAVAKNIGKNGPMASSLSRDLPEIEDALHLVQQAAALCNQFYFDFHGITDSALISNTYIAAGQQGMVIFNYDNNLHTKN